MRKTLFASAAVIGLALAVPAVAEQTTPDQYLSQALQYVQQHQALPAIAAVNNAEIVLLEPPTPYEFHGARALPGSPQVVRDIGHAREAIQLGNWGQAEHYIYAAMSHPSASLPGSLAGTVGGPNPGQS